MGSISRAYMGDKIDELFAEEIATAPVVVRIDGGICYVEKNSVPVLVIDVDNCDEYTSREMTRDRAEESGAFAEHESDGAVLTIQDISLYGKSALAEAVMLAVRNCAKLPPHCATWVESEKCAGIITRGESGYYPTKTLMKTAKDVDRFNSLLGVTTAQREAMEAGSMFGFHCGAADPDTYKRGKS
jgi:hypothetical protein